MSSEKRKFKYKLSGFEQMWAELERFEKREMLMLAYLDRMVMATKPKPTWEQTPEEIFLELLDEMSKLPGKSAGYKMIESMGVDFYEKAKEQFGE